MKVIDFDLIEAVFKGDELVRILNMFIDSFPLEIEDLETAYRNQDWKTLAALAFKLRDGASYFGAMRLMKVCTDLEDYLKSGANENIDEFYEDVLDELKLVKKSMQDFLKTTKLTIPII